MTMEALEGQLTADFMVEAAHVALLQRADVALKVIEPASPDGRNS